MDFKLMFLIWQHFKIWRDVTIVEKKEGRETEKRSSTNKSNKDAEYFHSCFYICSLSNSALLFYICHALLRSPGTGGRPKIERKSLTVLLLPFYRRVCITYGFPVNPFYILSAFFCSTLTFQNGSVTDGAASFTISAMDLSRKNWDVKILPKLHLKSFG